MPSLNMLGPHVLDSETIDQVVTNASAGNYALGFSKDKNFYVAYVGRVDSDLNARIKDWKGEYEEFKFSYAASPKAAFEKECTNYHDFGGSESLANKIHPDRPDGSSWKCPICDIFNKKKEMKSLYKISFRNNEEPLKTLILPYIY